MMIKQTKLLLVLLLLIAGQTNAQTIDSFHVNRSSQQLFVRLQFPDSSYYVERTFDRVALIYPPVNMVTFFYRSCEFIKANPVWDTTIRIYTPEPYGLWVWLANDSNTVTQGCTLAGQIQAIDSAYFDAKTTGIANPPAGNNSMYIFPNPAASILHVAGAVGCELRISDGVGRLRLQQKLQNGQESVDISSLVPGLYYIHCYRDGQLLQSHCFSKLP